jgi:hypothetical protein
MLPWEHETMAVQHAVKVTICRPRKLGHRQTEQSLSVPVCSATSGTTAAEVADAWATAAMLMTSAAMDVGTVIRMESIVVDVADRRGPRSWDAKEFVAAVHDLAAERVTSKD